MAQKSPIPALTGLRGLAVLAVIFEHYATWCAPYAASGEPAWLNHLTNTSAAGMTLFFTLSGFVIAYNYWDFDWRGSSLVSFVQFFGLRLSRLYPMLAVFILVAIKLDTALPALNEELPKVTAMALASAQSWLPLKVWNVSAVSLPGYGLSWSISTEIGMYLLFAAWLVLFAKLPGAARRWAILLSGAAIVIFGFLASYYFGPIGNWIADNVPTPFDPLTGNEAAYWFAYMSPYYRFSEFMLGVGAAVIVLRGYDARCRGVPAIFAGVAAIYLLGSYLDGLWPVAPSLFAWSPRDMIEATCFAAVMADSRRSGLINRLLATRGLVFVGTLSYSLYLFQGLLTGFTGGEQTGPFDLRLLPRGACNMALTLGLSIALAYGCYHLLEMPAQAWLRSLGRSLFSRAADERSVPPRENTPRTLVTRT